MAVITDVRAYPQFIPWITSMRVWDDQAHEFKAEAQVAYKLFRERFSTHVRVDPVANRVSIGLIRGPFRHLRSQWQVRAQADGGSEIEFFIDLDIKVPLLNGILTRGFGKFTQRLMQCFEDRAAALYGAQRSDTA